ncbi:MAG: aminoglycoside phosphotransferase family protein [Pseudolysinimonas sp.]
MDDQLGGGNMNAVRRVGDTVVRNAGPWTPTIHRFLVFLDAAGIDGIPRPVSIGRDREVLSFVAGEVPVYPLPEWVWSDEVLVDAAHRLRSLHDASVGFDVRDAIWQVPSHPPIEVICHNDFAPHNLAFENGRVVGAIDFDTCSPGSRMWDIAYLATRIVPLTAELPAGAPREGQSRRQIQLLLDSYGCDEDWTDVVRMAILRLHDLATFSIGKASELAKPHLRADAAGYERDAAHLMGVLDALG